MDVRLFLNNPSGRTRLAFRLEDRLSWLMAELKQIERTGTPTEQAALQGAIGELKRFIQTLVC